MILRTSGGEDTQEQALNICQSRAVRTVDVHGQDLRGFPLLLRASSLLDGLGKGHVAAVFRKSLGEYINDTPGQRYPGRTRSSLAAKIPNLSRADRTGTWMLEAPQKARLRLELRTKCLPRLAA